MNQFLRQNKIQPHTSNYYEQIDDTINRQLCLQCGGKAFYLHIWADPETGKPYKKEIVSCNQCEGGFRYGNKAG